MITTETLDSLQESEQFLDGLSTWDWGNGPANFTDCVEYFYRYYECRIDEDDFDYEQDKVRNKAFKKTFTEYLLSIGDNPADFDIQDCY